MAIEKQCATCKETKDADRNFTKRSGYFKKNGEPMYVSECKSCKSIKQHEITLKRRALREVKLPKITIDPYFLVRGTPKNLSSGSRIDNQGA